MSKRRSGRLVLDDVRFTAERGKVTAFLGGNGAGKSSTLRILLGLDHPTDGVALVDGVSYRQLADPICTVGAMLDGAGAHPARRAGDHLRWVAIAAGLPRTRVEEVLELVGLAGHLRTRVRTMSLGMRQRLGMATALLGQPEALVLDEPMNGMDPDGIRWIRQLVRQHADAGGAVLISSHLMHEVAEVADDLAVITAGRIVASGPMADVTAGHADLEAAFFALTSDDGAAGHLDVEEGPQA